MTGFYQKYYKRSTIIKGQQPSITVEDGLKVLKITKACQESLYTGKVIDIKL